MHCFFHVFYLAFAYHFFLITFSSLLTGFSLKLMLRKISRSSHVTFFEFLLISFLKTFAYQFLAGGEIIFLRSILLIWEDVCDFLSRFLKLFLNILSCFADACYFKIFSHITFFLARVFNSFSFQRREEPPS